MGDEKHKLSQCIYMWTVIVQSVLAYLTLNHSLLALSNILLPESVLNQPQKHHVDIFSYNQHVGGMAVHAPNTVDNPPIFLPLVCTSLLLSEGGMCTPVESLMLAGLLW